MHSTNMIKVIAIDLGDVYFHWNHKKYFAKIAKLCGSNVESVRSALNKNIRSAHVRRISNKDYWKYFCKSLGKNVRYAEFEKITIDHYKPNKPVISLMKKLREKHKLALVANQTEVVDKVEKKYKFYENFDYNLSSHIVKMQKPYKNIYKLLIKKAKCKPKEIVFIDDRQRNIVAAHKLGINTILFKNPIQLKKDLRKLGIVC